MTTTKPEPTTTRAPATLRVLHRDIAREARTHHGQWILVRFYDYPGAAQTTACDIRKGRITAYRPAGDYQAQCRDEPGAGFPVYVRYVGQEW